MTKKINKIWVTGDTHGLIDVRFKRSSNPNIFSKDVTKRDVLIIAGDFGFIFHGRFSNSEQVNFKSLERFPFTIAFIDGNHENFDRINKLPQIEKWGSTVGQASDNIFHLKRGNIYTINGKTILTIGGGYSVDKKFRIPGYSWWPEETITIQDIEIAIKNLEKYNNCVDYVITHTAPVNFVKELVFKRKITNIKLNNVESQIMLNHIYNIATFKKWYCGHFHCDYYNNGIHTIAEKIYEI